MQQNSAYFSKLKSTVDRGNAVSINNDSNYWGQSSRILSPGVGILY